MQRASKPNKIKLHFVENFSEGDTDLQLEAMKDYFELTNAEDCEVLFCASISKMSEALSLKRKHDKPLAIYCWDYYKWAHDGAKNYDWKRYADFMAMADLIFVPSEGQKLRLKELLGLDSVVVPTGIKTYEGEATDKEFILDPVRYYPEENRDWAERAAKELNIPIIHSEHQFSEEEFRKLVLSCTFMTCAYREASTGGLTLMEGLYHGKPSLVSDSPYMGAKTYLGEYGSYFKYDDFESLKRMMAMLWNTRVKLDNYKCKEYVTEIYSFDNMAKGLHKNICELLNS